MGGDWSLVALGHAPVGWGQSRVSQVWRDPLALVGRTDSSPEGSQTVMLMFKELRS